MSDDVMSELVVMREKVSKFEAVFAEREQARTDRYFTVVSLFQQVTNIQFAYALATVSAGILHNVWSMTTDLSSRNLVVVSALTWAVTTTIVSPCLAWALGNGATEGTSFFRDGLKLLDGAGPMILSWAWRDVVKAVVDHSPDVLWVRALISLAAVIVTSVCQLSPWYRKATADLKEGKNLLCARIAVTPGQVGLATGYAINETSRFFVENEPDTNYITVFLVQAGYAIIISMFIMWFKLMAWRAQNPTDDHRDNSEDKTAADVSPVSASGSSCASGCVAFLHAADRTLDDSFTFVFGWGWSDLMNDFFFGLFMACSGPTVA